MNSHQKAYDRDVTLDLVRSVAGRVGVEAGELTPLGTVIDPDLLRAFIVADATGADTSLQFNYENCTVTVYGDGRITITEEEHRNESIG